jgi:hypothetical protein
MRFSQQEIRLYQHFLQAFCAFPLPKDLTLLQTQGQAHFLRRKDCFEQRLHEPFKINNLFLSLFP